MLSSSMKMQVVCSINIKVCYPIFSCCFQVFMAKVQIQGLVLLLLCNPLRVSIGKKILTRAALSSVLSSIADDFLIAKSKQRFTKEIIFVGFDSYEHIKQKLLSNMRNRTEYSWTECKQESK